MTTEMKYMQWVATHLDWFEFHTPAALQLRREIRAWLYGSQDAVQAIQLQQRFLALFSGNPIQDVLYPTLQQEVRRQFTLKRGTMLAGMPSCAVTGRTIRAYGGPEQRWKDSSLFRRQLHSQAAKADRELRKVADTLLKGAAQEERWYRQQHINAWTLAAVLWYVFGMVSALLVLLPMVLALCREWGLEAALRESFPATHIYMGDALLAVPAVALLSLVLFVVKRKRMYYSAVAGLLWIKDIKRDNRARKRFFQRLVQKLQSEELILLAEQLYRVAGAMTQKGPDLLEKEDRSGEWMGQAGLRRLVQLPLPVIRSDWQKREKFYARIQKNTVQKPFWYFAAGTVLVAMVYGLMREPAGIQAVWNLVHGV